MRILFSIGAASVCAAIALTALSDTPVRAPWTQIFNGTDLAGWHTQGAATWQVEGGVVTGRVTQQGAGGWLMLDTGHEDFALRFLCKSSGAQAGVLVRNAPANWSRNSHAQSAGDQTTGILVSVSGRDTGAMYLVTLDSAGKELNRKPLPKAVGEHRPVEIASSPNGWNEVLITMRGPAIPQAENSPKHAVPFDAQQSHYGSLGLQVAGAAGAQVEFKDISLLDLTQRAAGVPAEAVGSGFQLIKITDLFYSEGIAAADVNHDGIQDVVAGPFYYLGPDYKRAGEIYPPETVNVAGPGEHGNYTDSFLNYVYDFNGDGWPDVLKINFEGAFLYINPKTELRHWDEYKVVGPISSETTQLADIDGDGRPELLIAQGGETSNQIAYAKPGADPAKPWTIHPISAKGAWAPHGFGVGDVNGDGRMDVVQGGGWWEQPPAGSTGLWKFHPVKFGHGPEAYLNGGADMFVYDVNGDGLPDVITSLNAHGPGLAWFEQKKDASGEITWKQHMIMGDPAEPTEARQSWEETDKNVAFTELHALALADMDGDGLKDIVTGKRWWSHGYIPEENQIDSPPVLYWFKLVRKAGGEVEFVPHMIDNDSGVGTQIVATDMNGDGKPDVLTTARKGTFVFMNHIEADLSR